MHGRKGILMQEKEMKIIVGDRQSGKTSALIRLADTSLPGVRYLVCHNKNGVYHAVEKAKRMGIDIRFPMTYRELPLQKGQRITHLLIDNLQFFLQSVCKGDVYAVACDIEGEDGLEILSRIEEV